MGQTLTRLAVVVGLALGVAACGDDDADSDGGGAASRRRCRRSPSRSPATRRRRASTRELAESYKSETGRTVNIVEVPERDVHLAKLTTSFSAGKAPEVFLLNYRYLGGFAAKGVIEPAGPRLDKSEAFDRDAFYPIPLQAFDYDGALQCVPQNASSLVTYVNLDAFEEAGIEPPKDSWTYDEFIAAAEKLTTARRHGIGLDLSTIRAAPWVWSAGGELVDDPAKPTKFLFDTPEGRRGLEHVIALQENGWAPNADEVDSKDVLDRFLDGSVAMFMSSRRDVPVAAHDHGLRVGRGAVPDRRRAGERAALGRLLHGEGRERRRGVAVDRVRARRAGPGGAGGVRAQRAVAAAVAESPAFLEPTDPPANSKVFVDALANMHQLPVTPNWSEVESRTDDILTELYYGRLELDAGLKRLG